MAILTHTVKVRVDAATHAALTRAAKAEARKPSDLARRILRRELVRVGELEEAVQRD